MTAGAAGAALTAASRGHFDLLPLRFRQPSPGGQDVERAEDGGGEARARRAEVLDGERPEGGADHHARVGGGADPAERLGPLVGRHGVADVGLDDAGGAAAGPLEQAEGEEQEDRVGEPEEGEGHGRRGQPHQQRRPPAVAVREAPPEGRREELRQGERRQDHGDHERPRAHAGGVERQQRRDEEESDHVHEDDGHEDPELFQRAGLHDPFFRGPLQRASPWPQTRNAAPLAAIRRTP